MVDLPQIIAGNWKMNLTLTEAEDFFSEFRTLVARQEAMKNSRQLILAPNFTVLSAVAAACRQTGVRLAAQNCAPQAAGAFTGETSVAMLKDVGVEYVLVGHSERRQLFAETDALLAEKLIAVVGAGLTPIFCVGETLEQRQAGEAETIVRSQLEAGLASLDKTSLIVAYEPVWAIGTGRTAAPEDAREMHAFIRRVLSQSLSQGKSVPILYGGSVKPENARELLAQPEINGLLVGGASLDAESFLAIAAA